MMDIFNNFLQYLSKYKVLGTEISINKTLLIGKAPHIGSEAWLHELYFGADRNELIALEQELGVSLPIDFKEFLQLSNGLAFFVTTLSIYGIRRTNSRNYEIREPFSIISKNKNEKPESFPSHYILIGSYFADNSKLVIDCHSGIVLRYSNDYNTVLNKWDNFKTFINNELPRIDNCYDTKGVLRTELKQTLPSNAVLD